ncbi:MAG: lipoprotein [Rickettsiales bacterium]|nr:lipoprotein [Rickettsiales bacterium]
MKKIILILSLLALVSSCKSKTIDIKSPCVSTEDGPCGPKKPVNEWWLKNSQNYKTNS